MRIKKEIFVVMFLSLIFIPTVLGLGISPPSVDYIFEAGAIKTGTVNIISRGDEFGAKISIEGDMAQYVSVDEKLIEVPMGGAEVHYILTFPQFLRPGSYKTYIVVEKGPKPSASGAGQMGFGATAAVVHSIYVTVPQTQRYAEVVFDNPGNIELGKPLNFKVSVINYGYEDLNDIKGAITVRDAKNVSVIRVETDTGSLKTGDRTDLYAHWVPTNVSIGWYSATAEVDYAGPQKYVSDPRPFRVGDIFIDLLDMLPKIYTPDKINKYALSVRSFWSAPLENVFAKVAIVEAGRDRQVITTPGLTLAGWQDGELVFFWDATGYNATDYVARATVSYGDGKTTEREFKLTRFVETPPVAAAGEAEDSSSALGIVIALVVIGIILALVGVIVHLVRRRTEE